VEKAVRKLLVASQKGGVGKTTTTMNLAAATAVAGTRVLLLDADPLSSISVSLNLAQNPRRQPLRQSGHDLPGVLVADVLPGLDVISPYDDGSCSDDDLDALFGLFAADAFRDGYGCLVVNTPPFLGANPGQLLGTCDEFILVMRAEPMAYRTMPAFLELVQRSRPAGNPMRMRGILLTLAEGDAPGCRWERELRGRFGTRVLPEVVPYDEEVGKSLLLGQIVTQVSPNAPAAACYHLLARDLGLAESAAPAARGGSPLLLAAAALGPVAARARTRPAVRVGSEPAPEVEREELVAAFSTPSATRGEPEESLRMDEPAGPETRAADPAPPVAPPSAVAPPPHRAPAAQPRYAWVGAAVVIGVLMRFVPLPDWVLPIIVGVCVSALVLVALRLNQDGSRADSASRRAGKGRKEGKRAAARSDPKKDSHARLAVLSRRAHTSSRRDRKN
jgi:chromosome partitioning protein